VTIHRHGHRKRVWRYRYVTTRFTRDVRVFLQMELANHNADYSGAGQPTYFYADIQSEYGNSPASTYPAPNRADPIDPGYPHMGSNGIDCRVPDLTFWDDGTSVAE
jgi:hypothetical protein